MKTLDSYGDDYRTAQLTIPLEVRSTLIIHKNFFNIKLFTPNSDSAFKSDLFESN